jgi:hypothetical protein
MGDKMAAQQPPVGSMRQTSRPAASPEEAAAIVAAIERFMRATAPASGQATPPTDNWRQTALLEATDRDPAGGDLRDSWINT